MNLAFMGLATVIMALEKLPEIGRLITRPLGVALLVSALGIALNAL
jgi:predicted metal-binding membrane protein